MKALTFLAGRFVAGDSIADALEAVRALNRDGIKATLDFLGEDCLLESQAEAATVEYENLLSAIDSARLDCNVSLKLSQFGLGLDPGLAEKNLRRVVRKAAAAGNFVRIDMESSAHTQATLDLFNKLFSEYDNVGIVIQGALKRSEGDIRALNAQRARVRLCKGAYKEPASVAFQAKEEICRNYDFLARELILEGNYPGIATHDEERIAAVLEFARSHKIGPERFEFQMLYGLRPRRWRELVSEGWNMRVYVPYGTHWFPYFSRRLRERKENWMFVLKNLLTG